MEELGHKQEKIALFCISQSALHLAKHIRVKYHFVQEKVEEESIDIQKIHIEDSLVDILTKSINIEKFIWCRLLA